MPVHKLFLAKNMLSYIFKRTVEVYGKDTGNAPERKIKILLMLTKGRTSKTERVYHVSLAGYEQGLIDLNEAEALLKSDVHLDACSDHLGATFEDRWYKEQHPWIISSPRTRSGRHIWIAERTTHTKTETLWYMNHTYVFATSRDELENIIAFM